MGKFQFGHFDTYARRPKSGKKGTSWSVREILGEADRVAENSPHVTNPLPPVQLAGCTPTELADRVDELLADRAIAGKRTPRGDIHVLAAAVYSWPEHVNYYDDARLQRWIKDQLAWHKANVGTVDCAVLHLDERFPHIHVYTVDPDARRLAPGWEAKREMLAAGKPAKEANAAYRAAMVEWQDELYEGVGMYHGLARLGPKRQRVPPSQWRKTKGDRMAVADAFNEARETLADLCEYVEQERIEAHVDASAYRNAAEREKAALEALQRQRLDAEGELHGLRFDARIARDTVQQLQYEIDTLTAKRDELRDSGGNAAPAAKPTPPKRGPTFNP